MKDVIRVACSVYLYTCIPVYVFTCVHVLVINDKNVPLHLENRIKLPERKGGRSRQSE